MQNADDGITTPAPSVSPSNRCTCPWPCTFWKILPCVWRVQLKLHSDSRSPTNVCYFEHCMTLRLIPRSQYSVYKFLDQLSYTCEKDCEEHVSMWVHTETFSSVRQVRVTNLSIHTFTRVWHTCTSFAHPNVPGSHFRKFCRYGLHVHL